MNDRDPWSPLDHLSEAELRDLIRPQPEADMRLKIEAYLGTPDQERGEAGENAHGDSERRKAESWARLLAPDGSWRSRFSLEQRTAILDAWREHLEAPVKDKAKAELHPTYRTDAKIRELVSQFHNLEDDGKSRNEAYQIVMGADCTKHLCPRFVAECEAQGRPWVKDKPGPKKGTKHSKVRQEKPSRLGPQFEGR